MDPEKISASKTLVEWIDIYNKKNPWDPFERDNTCALFFRPDKGFCEVLFSPNVVGIGQVCGDGAFWKNKVDETARKLGIGHGLTFDVRGQILAYMRLFNARVVSKEQAEDGLYRYHAVDKTTGKAVLASPAWKYNDCGVVAYRVIWEI